MKRVLILLTIFLLTGCSQKQNLNCKMIDESDDLTLTQQIDATFIDNKLKTATISVSYEVSKISMITNVRSSAKISFDEFTKYKGIKSKEKENGKKYEYELKLNMKKVDLEVKEKLGLREEEYLKLKDSLIGEGYMCE